MFVIVKVRPRQTIDSHIGALVIAKFLRTLNLSADVDGLGSFSSLATLQRTFQLVVSGHYDRVLIITAGTSSANGCPSNGGVLIVG